MRERLEMETKSWKKEWTAEGLPSDWWDTGWPLEAAPPTPTIAEFRRAAISFKERTCTADGAHPWHVRIWLRRRRPRALQWEQKVIKQKGVSLAPRQYIVETEWRQAARNEAAASGEGAGITLLWDLRKAYDSVQWAVLKREALSVGFPSTLLRSLLAPTSGRAR